MSEKIKQVYQVTYEGIVLDTATFVDHKPTKESLEQWKTSVIERYLLKNLKLKLGL